MSWLSNLIHPHFDQDLTSDSHSSSATAVAEPPAIAPTLPEIAVAPPKVEIPAMDVWQEGQRILEDFEVARELGQGDALCHTYAVLNTSSGRRYTVKQIRCEDADAQSEFLNALHDWMYLPEHPHLVACRFARLVGDNVAVFIDYAVGSTLTQLIADRQLYEGSANSTLDRILDIAIQAAWGLDAINEMKVAHQGVRPCTICVPANGVVKVTDIGLARATARGMRTDAGAVTLPEKSGVSYHPTEYAFAEGQAYIEDIWAWGASILQAFAANLKIDEKDNKPPEATSNLKLLELVQQQDALQSFCPAMPKTLAAVLRKCFDPDATQRWNRLGEAATALREVYKTLTKRAYPRLMPAILHRGSLLAIAHARWMPGGGAQWSSPAEWMNKAAPTGKPAVAARSCGSRSRQARADMDGYVQAKKMFEGVLAAGRKDLQHAYAILCLEKGFLHVSLGDMPAALSHFDIAITVLNEVVNKEGRSELANDLAMAHLNRAVALKHVAKLADAVATYAKAVAIWEQLILKQGRQELTGNLAWVKALRGEAMFLWANETQDLAAEFQKRADAAKAAADEHRVARQAESNPEKAAELNKAAQEQMDAAMDFSLKAGEAIVAFRERRQEAQEEGREALSLLKAEVKRTTRDDLKALLHWAQEVFEGLV